MNQDKGQDGQKAFTASQHDGMDGMSEVEGRTNGFR